MLSKQISILLSDLINSSFPTGTFPTKLKVSKVNPLHKKGSHLDPNNYRPISLLSVFSKIYEKVLYARLYKFLENSQLFYSKQFGFRSNHSTNYVLTNITETIKNSVDNGKSGCSTFFGLKKAFDTVSHDILLDDTNIYFDSEKLEKIEKLSMQN